VIRHFEKNQRGRDFVVGDIHGCFGLLETRLGEIGFSASSGDRLFSVGDLIDRGPRSIETLEFMYGIPIHAVRGNHEAMAIGVFDAAWDTGNYRANGGSWFFALTQPEQLQFADSFRTLPIAIEVETDNGLVGIVHANCPTDKWSDMHDGLYGDRADQFSMMCMWDRSRYQSNKTSSVAGVHQVIVGHTPVKEETIRGNVRYIDTGAVFGRKLTIIQL
jgi:serine/threonine protein phosphatase 1